MPTQRKELSFKGENIYVGFDVHLKSWKVTIMTEYHQHKSFVMPPSPEKLYEHLTANFPDGNYYSAYEAGFCGLWIHYRLMALGVNNIVVNPADIPTTQKEITQKDDIRDSRKIAHSLRNGSLVGIYTPRESTLSERSIIRMRTQIIKDLNRCRHRLKSHLYFYGIDYPPQFETVKSHWSNKFMSWIESLVMADASGKIVIDILLSEVRELRKLLLEANTHMRNLSENEKYSRQTAILTSVPGIGIITAMNILTELEDINRFSSFDRFCSFVGLVPSTCSSGEKESVRGITFRGHRLRRMIIESAWVAIGRDPVMSKSYLDYRRRMDANKAIIRVARKMLCRIYSLLKNDQLYEPGRVS